MVRRALVVGVALCLALIGFAYWSAVRDPAIRRASIGLARWPADVEPITLGFVSDIHVAGPDMPPSRLAEIVRQLNSLGPDLVLIAGDFVSDKRTATRFYEAESALKPLSLLEAPLGTVAVLGNHDHWRGRAEVAEALSLYDVTVLANESMDRGPLTIVGVDDAFTDHDDLASAVAELDRRQPAIALTHSPDIFPDIPRTIALTLAGHTHCGQIRLPLIGAISTMSDYGERYACGFTREGGRALITSAGLGTSILPLRFGTAPEIWLITVGPRR